MDQARQTAWKDELLGEILRAVSMHAPLKPVLIFKGARILNLHLGNHRQSLDIDANLHFEFQRDVPDPQEQTAWFEKQLTMALRNYFEDQDPVRYELDSVKVVRNPPTTPHPMGWDGLVAKIKVTDQKLRGVRGLPTMDLEIAAPETLGADAVCELPMDGLTIQAYALHRIAGEKMRAFLTSLPAYRNKISSSHRDVRAKDLHDLARILEAKPIEDKEFWKCAAHEFRLACESRYVDCEKPETFHQHWSRTRAVYESDPQLAAVSWQDADDALSSILALFERLQVFPLSFPLDD
jgi:hypothetical protein